MRDYSKPTDRVFNRKEDLKDYNTQELVNELRKRDKVRVDALGCQEQRCYCASPDGIQKIEGPCVVLIVREVSIL